MLQCNIDGAEGADRGHCDPAELAALDRLPAIG